MYGGDTGRYTICINAAKSFIKYWHRFVNTKEEQNSLLYNAYMENITGKNPLITVRPVLYRCI